MKNRPLSLVLATAMLFSMAHVPAAAQEAPESGAWYEAAMNTWAQRGVLQGDQAGNLNPTADITRAELAVMLDRIMDYQVTGSNSFGDVQAGSWYADAVLKASAAGVLQGDGANARPAAKITRQETMVMLSRVLNISGSASDYASYADASQVAGWAAQGVGAMVAGGYVQGSGGYLNPAANITRAEVATILDNVFQGYYQKSGTYDQDVNGSAVINTDGVILSDMTIAGDLILAEGVADGSVTLHNVTLGGRLLVRGGGPNSVIISGSSAIDSVIVSRQEGTVRLSVQDNAVLSSVNVAAGAHGVKLAGKVGAVTVAAPSAVEIAGTVNQANLTAEAAGASLTVSGAVKEMSIASGADGVSLNVTAGGGITALTSAASNLNVTGSGTITAFTVTGGSGVTIADSVTVITLVNNSASSVTLGDKEVAAGETGSSTGGTDGGGSGSGGSATSSYTVSLWDKADDNDPYQLRDTVTVRADGTLDESALYDSQGYAYRWYERGNDGVYTLWDFTSPITEDKSIYGVRADVTIKYELGEHGRGNGGNPYAYMAEDGEVSLKDAAAEDGFVFEGWYSDPSFTTQVTKIDPSTAEKITLYAKWSQVAAP